ncbi:MAG: thiamine pyrophosphate-binding protein, partial [Nocardiopsaceae bacterium]|nr:thiamine pyrophosphate-binding protein [Nocardiopsaceae bacterium]
MLVSDAVAAVLADFGADTVFGVVGSGNFHVTNALVARGARFVAARHECGAASMADGWARLSGRPGILSVHQGPGLTNAVTGITEAAKSRTPMVVLAADVAASAIRSNFRIDVAELASSIGAVPARLHSPDFAVDDTIRAYRTAVVERQTVVLALPLDVQAAECPVPPAELLETARAGLADKREPLAGPARDQARGPGPRAQLIREAAGPEATSHLADAIRGAQRPVFIAGRGARNARARTQLEQLAGRCGALLATSAAAKGLFRGSPWDLDVSGGFASPLAAELIRGADLVVGWGSSLNMWTMRHGSLISPGTVVAQVDDEPSALGGHRPINLGVLGDIADVASDVSAAWGDEVVTGY